MIVEVSTVKDSMEEIFVPVENVISRVKKDFRCLIAVYICTAEEDTECDCEHFVAGVSGKCCYAEEGVVLNKYCRWVKG